MLAYLMPLLVFLALFFNGAAMAKVSTYGESICQQDGYVCQDIAVKESWESLWPDADQRDIVKRLNRMNIRLRAGMTIAVPDKIEKVTLLDVSPFPKKIEALTQKTIHVDLTKLAWGAYGKNGTLERWGPASGGKGWCGDIGGKCKTRPGEYFIERKGGAKCKSGKFPIPRGGAPMPYCLFFYRGYAIHGSSEVPGYNASHGCVRTLVEDAKWLNEEFVELENKSEKEGEDLRTKIIILPY